MDVNLARTLLAIVETGSFKDAAQKLHVTQSTISARVKTLEIALGKQLLERSKSGVSLTPAGEQFLRHATALVRVWHHALLEVGLADAHSDHFAIGAQISLWEGFLLRWIAWMREAHPRIAITANVGASADLIERLSEGTLDLAVVYRPTSRPGLVVEHIFDEELVMVTSSDRASRKPGPGYVFVNWGPEFAADHTETYPELSHTGLHLDLGAIGMNYLLDTKASGYFPTRIAKPYIDEGLLRLVPKARRFVYPVYAVYPENRDEASFDPLLEGLRTTADQT
jgi:LysR family transcriptional regulator, flagellar master operon regulator